MGFRRSSRPPPPTEEDYNRRTQPKTTGRMMRRLPLTEVEYNKQTQLETMRALEELREFCKEKRLSPSWEEEVVGRLERQDRFTEFLEGTSHLTEEEVVEHGRNCSF